MLPCLLGMLMPSSGAPVALRTVVRSEGITALVATHDTALIDVADAVLGLADGQLGPAG